MENISSPLLSWYDAHKRSLPWRGVKNAYLTWVSEIMLQQTRIEAVKTYYVRFTKELPTVEALASCPEERLLKLWEGLGYYSRVKNMKLAAIDVCENHGGKFPSTKAELLTLKGIGDYTASAIASITFGEKVPCVDGNVLRIYARVMADGEDILSAGMKKKVGRDLLSIMSTERPGDFNEALMELGQTVCLPGEPLCTQCPLSKYCMAYTYGGTDRYPYKKPKKAPREEERTILIIQDGEENALHKRPNKGLLAGLYEPVNLSGSLDRQQALSKVEDLGLTPLYIEELPPAVHIFSHIIWRMIAYRIRVAALREGKDNDLLFVRREEVSETYALPSAFDAYRPYLSSEGKDPS